MGLSLLTWIRLGAFAALAIAVGLFYWHYEALNAERDQLLLDKASLERSVDTLRKQREEDAKTVKRWQDDAAQKAGEVKRLDESRKEARGYARKLNEFFGSVDLSKEARDDRDTLERRINSGTADALRLWRCSTGDGASCAAPGAAEAAGPAAPGAR